MRIRAGNFSLRHRDLATEFPTELGIAGERNSSCLRLYLRDNRCKTNAVNTLTNLCTSIFTDIYGTKKAHWLVLQDNERSRGGRGRGSGEGVVTR